jgi:hypothetical protein
MGARVIKVGIHDVDMRARDIDMGNHANAMGTPRQ